MVGIYLGLTATGIREEIPKLTVALLMVRLSEGHSRLLIAR
jgi:hypothetical protein